MDVPYIALQGLACLALAAACNQPPAPPPRVQEAPVEPFFRARRQWDVDGKTESLLAADLDGDGHAELVAALQHGALVVWRGTPSGLDRAARTIAVGGWPLKPVALPAGSFGAAASQRLVAVASRADRTLLVYDLTGGAVPRALWRGGDPLSTPRTIAVGDLGADGNGEIAMATDDELVVVGEGGATARHELAHALPRCSTFRGDGSGVWIGYQDSRTLEVAAGAPRVLALEGIPRDVVELDLGGVPGLLVVGGVRDARVYGLDGTPFMNWSSGPIPIDVELGDFNGDGAPEIAVLTRYGLSYELGPKGPVRGYAGQTPTSIAVADFTGDGAVDLAIANRDARAISLVRGDGAGGVLDAVHVPVGVTPTSIVAGQLTGDERPEVATLNSKSGTLTVLRNEAGALVAHGEVEVGPSPRGLVIADVAGDEEPDLAWVAQDGRGARLEVGMADEQGVGRYARPMLLSGRSGRDLLALDLFPGGTSELLMADRDAGLLLGFVSRRDLFHERWSPNFLRVEVPSAPVAVRAIEIDGDEDPELAVAVGAPGPRLGIALLDLVLSGDEFGQRTCDATEFTLVDTVGWPIDLAVSDLNGDGLEDMVVLSLDGPDGPGGFVQALIRHPQTSNFIAGEPQRTGARPHHLAVGDVNGDGIDDVFVDSQNSHVINGWLTRVGAHGVQLERLDDIGAHLGCLDVALADVNGDGRLDLVVANGFSDDVSVILNLPR
jgi:hypothetical protein